MILVVNSGSSTIKFALYANLDLQLQMNGVIEALDSPNATMNYRFAECDRRIHLPSANHQKALESIVSLLQSMFTELKLSGIGHRVVHGGELFSAAALINQSVTDRIEELSPLAPLHNPANLLGIQAFQKLCPAVPQVAVFDTAFHQTMPSKAFRYAIPERFYTDHALRRYGAHGTSHQFVAHQVAERLQNPIEKLQLITVHLGNGCSACAIRDGKSVDTTMGLTPHEGMMMGTRSGDVDPMLHGYLMERTGMSIEAVTELLTRQSGLLGVSGTTNDCRELESQMSGGDERANRALELFCYRAAKCILGMAAGLSRVDALVFTGGIGENSSFVREQIIALLTALQLVIDTDANRINGTDSSGCISLGNGPSVFVVKTDEELAIAQQTAGLI